MASKTKIEIKVYGLWLAKRAKSVFCLGIEITKKPYQLGVGFGFWLLHIRLLDGKEYSEYPVK